MVIRRRRNRRPAPAPPSRSVRRVRRSTALAIVGAGLFVLGLATTASRAQGSASDLFGRWQGVYHAYPEVMRLDLEIRSGAGGIEGELRFAPLTEGRPNALGAFRGGFRVRGTYDPGTRAFVLEPGPWLERPTQLATPLLMAGVLAPDGQAMAGVFPNAPVSMNPHFALARPERAERMLLEPAADLADRPGPAGRSRSWRDVLRQQTGIRLPAGRGGGDLDKIVAWASVLLAEYPAMDLRNTAFEQVYRDARPLFDDVHFTPHFGKSFDEMSSGDRRKLFEALQHQGRESVEEREARMRFSVLQRAFAATGTFSAPDVGIAALSLRIIRAWRDDMMARLPTMPLEETSLSHIDRVEEAASRLEVAFLPTDRGKLVEEAATARVRVAVPVLTASADSVLRTAQGYEGAVELAAWETRHARAFSVAPEPTQAELRDRIQTRLDDLLTGLMDQELPALDGFGRGREAVVAGRTWFLNFKTRYAFASGRPPVTTALRRITDRRGRDLLAVRAQLESEIDAQGDDAGLDALAAKYLVGPEDGMTEGGRAIERRIDERRRTLDRERYVAANFTAGERARMDARGSVVVPAGYVLPGPQQLKPSSEDVRMAILRAFLDAGGRRTGPFRSTFGYAFLAGMFGIDVEIQNPVLGRIEPAAGRCGEWQAAGGYCIAYEPRLHFRASQEIGELLAGSVQGQMMSGMLTVANNAAPDARVDNFVLTADGWKAPSLALELKAKNMSLFIKVPKP